MKKSIWKKAFCSAKQESISDQEMSIARINDLQEALDRRRQLCKTMEELVDRGQSKSLEEMAAALYFHALDMVVGVSVYSCTRWENLNQESKDQWMDRLLKIIG